MTDFLSSLKADLLDRRLLPLVGLVAAALVAALALRRARRRFDCDATPAAAGVDRLRHRLLGPGDQPERAPKRRSPRRPAASPSSVGGAARNPFTPLPQAKTKTSATPASAAKSTTSAGSSGSSATSGTGSSSSSSSESSSTAPSTPSTPAKPKTVYHVAVLFGVLPAGATPQSAQLTPYENLKLLTPLPSAEQPLIVFRGVTAGGKSATFTLVGEAILHGDAALPAERRAVRSDRPAGGAVRAARIPAAERPGGHLRTAGS